jgi:4-hydroxybenzoate polyprenyltransferase
LLAKQQSNWLMASMTSTRNQFRLMPWLRLFRIANLPSAISNVLMGFLLVHQSWTPTVELILLLLASSSLYLAGMVLNDFYDLEVDLSQRPGRPLPANQISRKTAGYVGFVLLVSGIVLAFVAGWVASLPEGSQPISISLLRPGLIAGSLALFVYLYDGPLKRTIAAPFLMGGCRTLNILLGASTFLGPPAGLENGTNGEWFGLGFPAIVWWIAIAIGALIAGATLLGRNEAVETQSRTPLVLAGLTILAGLGGLAFVVYCPAKTISISHQMKNVFPLFIGLISLSIIRRIGAAIVIAKPQPIQQGVVAILRSLIIFDAAICFLAVPDNIVYALIVFALLLPTLLLGKFISST